MAPPECAPTTVSCPACLQLHVDRILVCARKKLWWMTPEWRSSTLQIPPETQFLLAELKGGNGKYVLVLPLLDGDFRATLRA
mmetsp:Transcript_16551/g.49374  ORF Transcript_16551/g.49374 Transcript_16551/m.49374 type:complete len:82 (+) Transcript_16551:702-947(+)